VQNNTTASSQFWQDRSSLYTTEERRVSLRPSCRKSAEGFHTQNVTAGHNFIAPEPESILKPCREKMPKKLTSDIPAIYVTSQSNHKFKMGIKLQHYITKRRTQSNG